MACPICAKDSDQKYRPFCSRRCADIDLGRWVTGSYAIPSEREEDAQISEEIDLEAGMNPASRH